MYEVGTPKWRMIEHQKLADGGRIAMPMIFSLRRAFIALVGYGVLAVFAAVYFASKRLSQSLTPKEALILSGAAVAPLVLALVWEHVKGVKIGQIEFTLNEVTPTLHVELAEQIQQQVESSGSTALVEAVRGAAGKKDFKLLEINLRSTAYWWSTRLYLLAALSEEYTNIERLVFVEQDAARLFVGTAAPAALRKALANRFRDFDRVFRQIQTKVKESNFPDPMSELEAVVGLWSYQSLFKSIEQAGAASEYDVKQLTVSADLMVWAGSALETESRQWSGSWPNRSLYAKVLTCAVPYVPLLNGARLEKIVNRAELAEKLAASVVF